MSLLEKISSDLTNALKLGETEKVGVLRFILAQIHNKEIEMRGSGKNPVLTDSEVGDVLLREAKKRREAIQFFKQSGREDLVMKEEKEMGHLEVYLPKQLGRAEVEKEVNELMVKGVDDFNSLMKEVMAKLRGQVDGKLVSEVVKERQGKN